MVLLISALLLEKASELKDSVNKLNCHSKDNLTVCVLNHENCNIFQSVKFDNTLKTQNTLFDTKFSLEAVDGMYEKQALLKIEKNFSKSKLSTQKKEQDSYTAQNQKVDVYDKANLNKKMPDIRFGSVLFYSLFVLGLVGSALTVSYCAVYGQNPDWRIILGLLVFTAFVIAVGTVWYFLNNRNKAKEQYNDSNSKKDMIQHKENNIQFKNSQTGYANEQFVQSNQGNHSKGLEFRQ